MKAYRVHLTETDRTLTVIGEDQGDVQRLMGLCRHVLEVGFGVRLGSWNSRVLADRDLTPEDRELIAHAQRTAPGRPAGPFVLRPAMAALTAATGSEDRAARVMDLLRDGFGGAVPSSVAVALANGTTPPARSPAGEPVVAVLDRAADRVRESAA